MHSGGGTKEKYSHIYIEAPRDEAIVIFYNRFGHNPERVSCTCCGPDYSIDEAKSLEQATAYHRGCAFVNNPKEQGGGHYVERPSPRRYSRGYMTLDEYKKSGDALVIPAAEIQPDERVGSVPEQGYVWMG